MLFEPVADESSTSLNKKFIAIVILLVVGLLVFLGFLFFPRSNTSSIEFLKKYREVQVLFDSTYISSAINYGELSQRASASDFVNVYEMVKKFSDNYSSNKSQIERLRVEVAELKKMSGSIPSGQAQTSVLKILNLLEQRNVRLSRFIDYNKQMVDMFLPYYGALVNGGQPQTQLGDVEKGVSIISQEANAISQLQFQIDSALQEFLDATGIDPNTSSLNSSNLAVGLTGAQTSGINNMGGDSGDASLPSLPPSASPTQAKKNLSSENVSLLLKVSTEKIKILSDKNNLDSGEKAELTLTYSNLSDESVLNPKFEITHSDLIVKESLGVTKDNTESVNEKSVFTVSSINPGATASAVFNVYAGSVGKKDIKVSLKISDNLSIESNSISIEGIEK